MILLALFPFAWRKVMDPKVLAHFDGNIALANIQPRKHQRITARYGSALPSNTATINPASGPTFGVTAYTCPGCNYTYDQAEGDIREGFAPGTAFSDIPETWFCPDCGVRERNDFLPLTRV